MLPSNPSTELYALGKGILSVAEWDGSTPPEAGDFRDVGNCTDFNVEVTEESLPHYSSRSGIRKKDKTATLEIGYNLNFTLDENSVANLAMFLRGTASGNVISAATNLDVEFAIKFASDNPVGPDQTWEFWKATLKPNGAMNLISEEWVSMSFTGEGLADDTNHADSPYFDVTCAYDDSTTTS